MLRKLIIVAAFAALLFVANAAASAEDGFWHHTTDNGATVCNDNQNAVGAPSEDGFVLVANVADAGPFDTRDACEQYQPAPDPTPAAHVSVPDHYLWCNSQTEQAPFSLSLAESLTLTSNWYRPLFIDGAPTCATAGATVTGVFVDSNGNGSYNATQYAADLAYWGVSSLYEMATR